MFLVILMLNVPFFFSKPKAECMNFVGITNTQSLKKANSFKHGAKLQQARLIGASDVVNNVWHPMP